MPKPIEGRHHIPPRMSQDTEGWAHRMADQVEQFLLEPIENLAGDLVPDCPDGPEAELTCTDCDRVRDHIEARLRLYILREMMT